MKIRGIVLTVVTRVRKSNEERKIAFGRRKIGRAQSQTLKKMYPCTQRYGAYCISGVEGVVKRLSTRYDWSMPSTKGKAARKAVRAGQVLAQPDFRVKLSDQSNKPEQLDHQQEPSIHQSLEDNR